MFAQGRPSKIKEIFFSVQTFISSNFNLEIIQFPLSFNLKASIRGYSAFECKKDRKDHCTAKTRAECEDFVLKELSVAKTNYKGVK